MTVSAPVQAAAPTAPGATGGVASRPGAAFFDLDKTVIATSSTLALGRSFYSSGLIDRRAVIKGAYAQLVYGIAGADEGQMSRMRDAMAEMSRGWEVAQVEAVVDEALHELLDPLVYDEAVDLIESHRAAGREIVIVSSSGIEVVAPIGARLGVDRVVATRMEVVDGRYTGVVAFYAYGEHKAEAMRELAVDGGYDLADCYAYSDSYTDLPMLSAVGHPTAVNPDRALRRAAVARSWPVLEFRRTVRLRDRIPRIPRPPLPSATTGAAVGAVGAAAVGAAMWRRRHR